MKRAVFRAILFALKPLLERAARKHSSFRIMLRQHNIVAQIQLKDGSLARHFIIADGRVKSRGGLHPRPDVAMVFKDVDTALVLMNPNPKMNDVVHAAKNFKVQVMGPDFLCVWFMQLLNLMN
jgi:hypothetical protein